MLPMRTSAAALFGTSIPTSDLPGIGASMRIGCAARDIANCRIERRDARQFYAFGGLQRVACDGRANIDLAHLNGDTETFERPLDDIAFARRSPVVGFDVSEFRSESGGGT